MFQCKDIDEITNCSLLTIDLRISYCGGSIKHSSDYKCMGMLWYLYSQYIDIYLFTQKGRYLSRNLAKIDFNPYSQIILPQNYCLLLYVVLKGTSTCI